MNRVRLYFKDLSEIVGSKGFAVARLIDGDGQRVISIICDKAVTNQLSMRITRMPGRERLLPEVLCYLLQAEGSNCMELMVYDIFDGQYQVTLLHRPNLSLRPIRMSDAVLLHYIAKVPLYIEADLMQRQSTPYVPEQTGISIPINTLDSKRLSDELQRAIDAEDYRLASILHEELRRRTK